MVTQSVRFLRLAALPQVAVLVRQSVQGSSSWVGSGIGTFCRTRGRVVALVIVLSNVHPYGTLPPLRTYNTRQSFFLKSSELYAARFFPRIPRATCPSHALRDERPLRALMLHVPDSEMILRAFAMSFPPRSKIPFPQMKFHVVAGNRPGKPLRSKVYEDEDRTSASFVLGRIRGKRFKGAMPTVPPKPEDFISPGSLFAEGAMRSPTAIGPPSMVTFRGTRPASASGTRTSFWYFSLLNPPSKRPGY